MLLAHAEEGSPSAAATPSLPASIPAYSHCSVIFPFFCASIRPLLLDIGRRCICRHTCRLFLSVVRPPVQGRTGRAGSHQWSPLVRLRVSIVDVDHICVAQVRARVSAATAAKVIAYPPQFTNADASLNRLTRALRSELTRCHLVDRERPSLPRPARRRRAHGSLRRCRDLREWPYGRVRRPLAYSTTTTRGCRGARWRSLSTTAPRRSTIGPARSRSSPPMACLVTPS
jgi:hypothetical protein